MIMDNITPRAIISLFNFSRTAKISKLGREPNVMSLPKVPCNSILSIPVQKSEEVKSFMKRKLPNSVPKKPKITPSIMALLFIPLP